jgi:hypothetical protein
MRTGIRSDDPIISDNLHLAQKRGAGAQPSRGRFLLWKSHK